jgi:hypothetical protein
VWVTEVGYPSTPLLQASPEYTKELGDKYQGGEAGQARFLTDTFRALADDDNVVGINWTFPVDPNMIRTPSSGANDKTVFDDGFGDGLVSSNYQTKSSYQAFQRIAAEGGRPSRPRE